MSEVSSYECPCGYLGKGDMCSKCETSRSASEFATKLSEKIRFHLDLPAVRLADLPKRERAALMKAVRELV